MLSWFKFSRQKIHIQNKVLLIVDGNLFITIIVIIVIIIRSEGGSSDEKLYWEFMFICLDSQATRKNEINILFDNSRKTIKNAPRYYTFEKRTTTTTATKNQKSTRSEIFDVSTHLTFLLNNFRLLKILIIVIFNRNFLVGSKETFRRHIYPCAIVFWL